MTAGTKAVRAAGSGAQAPPGWTPACARIAAGAAIAIAAIVLVGWVLDAHVLQAFSTGAVHMKTNAAIGVVIAGVAILVKAGDPPRRRRRLGDGLGLACLVLGLVTLAEYLTEWQPGIDELLFSEALTAVRTSSPNRMAASAAVCLVGLGAAVVLLGRGRRRTAVAQGLGAVVAVLGVLALVGYGFGSSLLYQWRRSTAAAIPAGIAFLLLGAALAVAGGGPPLSLLTSRGPGGLLARRLLPLIVVLPLGVGLLLHLGGEQGWADAALQTALAALVTIVLLTALTLTIGLRLDRVDAARAAADAELRVLNAGLEREVRTRTAALQAKTAELERSNRDLEQFAYIASHDLQEPLRMVSNYTRLLADDLGDRLDDTARRHLDYAADGAARMHQLINDLLRFSRVGRAGTPHRVDCDQLVQTVAADLHEAILAAGATVTHDRLPTVTGVPPELRQLFTNLVGNAIKFRGDQLVHVHISAARDGPMWQYAIVDDGIGIDPAQAERIFEVFKRLHTRDRYPGTGIGLAICKKVVEHHGGRIWVESQPGTGATFRFTLPAADNAAEDQ